jgi:hypothetical protein
LIAQTILGEEHRSFRSLLCSLLCSPVNSSLLGPNILLNTLFSNTLIQCSPSKSATKFHTHTKLELCIYLSLNSWIANWKTKYSASNDRKHFLTSICSWFRPESNFDLLMILPNI